MKSILGFEIYKLLKKKLFIALCFLLLLGNLLALCMYEQHRAAYYYIFEGRAQYEAFLLGDESADVEGYYTEDLQRQEEYAKNYEVFLSGMEKQAERLYKIHGGDSFVYKNARKTCEDFADLSEVRIVADNCFGIREVMQYDMGIFFVFAFLGILAYFLFFEERNKGLFLLVKGTKKGHGHLAAGKTGCMAVFAVLYTCLQECLNVAVFGYLYGFGDMSRSLQSVPEFRSCSYVLSVAEGIGAMIGIRILIAGMLAVFIGWLSIAVRNEITAIVLGAAILTVESTLHSTIYISSPINLLKCMNPFFYWNMEEVLATYLNLNIFGIPVGKETCAAVAFLLCVLVCFVAGIICFHKVCQIRTQSRLEQLQIWLRKKTGFWWRHTGLLRFEFKKVLIQQKKAVVVLVLFLLCVSDLQNTNVYYSTALRAGYHVHMEQLSGKVTDESIAYVEEQKAYIAQLRETLASLDTNTGEGYAQSLLLQHELDMQKDAVIKLSSQLEGLKNMEGSIYDKYWVNELEYPELWGDAKTDVLWWFAGTALLTVWISGIYPMDEKKGLVPLLNTSKYGRKALKRRKNLCVVVGTIVMFVLAELPKFMDYFEIDGFACLGQKLCHFTNLWLNSELTIGGFLAIIFGLKFLSFVAITLLVLYISRKTKNEMITNVIGIGTVGIITFICLYFNFSISVNLLTLLYNLAV